MDVLFQKVSLQGTEFLQVEAEHIKYILKFCASRLLERRKSLYQDRCTQTVLVVDMALFPPSHFHVIFKVTLKEHSFRMIVQVCESNFKRI